LRDLRVPTSSRVPGCMAPLMAAECPAYLAMSRDRGDGRPVWAEPKIALPSRGENVVVAADDVFARLGIDVALSLDLIAVAIAEDVDHVEHLQRLKGSTGSGIPARVPFRLAPAR